MHFYMIKYFKTNKLTKSMKKYMDINEHSFSSCDIYATSIWN